MVEVEISATQDNPDLETACRYAPGGDACVADRARRPNEMAHLGVPVRAQRHHRNRADPAQREVDEHEVEPVRELHDDPVERPDAEPVQAVGEAR